MTSASITLQWVLVISLADMLAVLLLLLWIARILVRIEKLLETVARSPAMLDVENIEPLPDANWPYPSPMRDDRTP